MNTKVLLMIAALPAMAACQTTSTGEDLMAEGWFPMTGEQIQTVFTGNTLESERWSAYYPNDHEVIGLLGSSDKDTGVWLAKDNQYCRTYTRWGKGKETCVSLYRRASEILFPSGDVAVVKDGNTKGL